MFYKSNILNAFPIHSSADSKVGAVGSVPPPRPTGVDLYSRFAFAGAVCCSVTHGALTPVDVVKTRIQLEPEVYNKVRLSPMSTLSVLVASCSVEMPQTCATETSVFGPLQNFRWLFKHERLFFQMSSCVAPNTPADTVSPVSSREWYRLSAKLSGMRVLVHF